MKSKFTTVVRCLAFSTLIALAGGVASGADEYKVKLTRPVKVGDEYKETTSVTQSRRTEGTADGKPIPAHKESFTVEMTATVKIDAIEEKFGQATKVTVTVDKLTKDGNELYPAGTVITAEKDGKDDLFKINGEKVEGDNVEILSDVIDVAKKDKKVCDDQMRGTDKPQSVGGTWDVNAAKIVEDAATDGVTIPVEKVSGKSTLVEVKEIDGIKQMTIKSEMKTDGAKMDLENAGGATVEGGTATMSGSTVYPLDESMRETSEQITMRMTMDIALPNNSGAVTVITEVEKKVTHKKAN